MSDTQPLETIATREIGIECSCGFKRRATKISDDDTRWNGREIEALHWLQIEQEASTAAAHASEPIKALPVHKMSMGLFATMDWSPVTAEEQKIGEAWLAGYARGRGDARAHFKEKLARVTFEEFGP